MEDEILVKGKLTRGDLKATLTLPEGTKDYEKLRNLPTINGVPLKGEITDEQKTFICQNAISLVSGVTNDIAGLSATVTGLQNSIAGKVDGAYVESGYLYLTAGDAIAAGPLGPFGAGGGGGLSFNSGYVDGENLLHLTLEGEDIEGFDPFKIPAGAGGGGGDAGSRMIFAMLTAVNFSVLQSSGSAKIKFNFTSTDTQTGTATGNGSLVISVGGIAKETISVPQGENEIDVFKHLTMGTNEVRLAMTDSYGTTATRTVTISLETFSVSWNLGNTARSTGALAFYVTPVGSGPKKIKVYVDGIETDSQTVTSSGRRVDFLINMTGGAHLVEVQGQMTVGGATLLSDRLACAVAQVTDPVSSTVIAARLPIDEADQYSTLSIPYRVISTNNPASIELWAGGVKVADQTVDQSEQIWAYRVGSVGNVTLEIRCGTTKWTKTIMVKGLSSDVSEVTFGLAYKLDPNTLADLSGFTLSDHFDTLNGGLVQDGEGVRCLKVCKGDRLTIPYKPFSSDCRSSGSEIKLIYKVSNSIVFDGTAISCISSGTGFNIKANSAEFSTSQSSLTLPTCEDVKTELDINIEPDSADRLLTFWESGSPTAATVYARNDSFMQTPAVHITVGSDDCDVYLYLLRVYSRDLTKEELRSNFEADGKDAAEIVARHDRNQVYGSTGKLDPTRVAALNPQLHVITWHAPGISTAKSMKIKGTLTHVLASGGNSHSWTAENVTQKAQGTSSLGYVQAGCNEDFEFSSITLADGTTQTGYAMTDNSIPVGYLNYKTNVASQEHINNILMNDWINEYNPYIRKARQDNPKVRDTVEGHMCAFFYHNTSDQIVSVGPYDVQPDETIFYSLGCLNNSKKNNEVFGYDDIVLEVSNNTDDLCRFKSDDLSGELYDGSGSYEYRYLNEEKYNEQTAGALWAPFLKWVVSCDSEKATNTAFSPAKIINGVAYTVDNAAYRMAKFKSEADQYMVVDSVIYHYLSTLVFSQVDNRAKNTFWGYDETLKKWHLAFAYDNDTAMGNDNEGGLTLRYGYMDTDTIGTKSVFNAADSALFNMVRKAFPNEIRSMFIALENEGAWDLDVFAAKCDAEQAKACEALWIEDAWRKDIDTFTMLGTSAYLPMLNGKKRLQRRQFLHFQRAFFSSYFDSGYANSQSATIRAYTPSTWTGVEPKSEMTITPYSHLWVTVKAGSKTIQKRAEAGKPVLVSFDTAALNDTETYVRMAGFIQDLGDISHLYPGYLDISNCTRLRRLQAGSSETGYSNTNLTEVGVSAAKSLEYLNVIGCPNLSQELDLDSNSSLKEIYTNGSGVTGVAFAPYGRLEKVELNGVASITAVNLSRIETFALESGVNLTALNISGTPAIDVLSIAKGCGNLTRVRLKEQNWSATVDDYDTIYTLGSAAGIDDDGHTTETAVITGTCIFDKIGSTKYNTLTELIPGMTFAAQTYMQEYTVTFKSDAGTTLLVATTESGGSVTDPVASGVLQTPVKDPDVDYLYTYVGWDKPLFNITANIEVNPTFSRKPRTYTVNFVDYNGDVLESYVVNAHGSCSYQGEILHRDGWIWMGWDQDTSDVVSDMQVNAAYTFASLPAEIKNLEDYDYAYSDDPADNSAYTFGELYQIIKTGQAADYLPIGSEIKMKTTRLAVTDTEIVFVTHSYGHYELPDGSGMTNIDFYMKGILNGSRAITSAYNNTGGWPTSEIRTWLNGEFLKAFPDHWKQLMIKAVCLSSAGNQSPNIVSAEDYIRLMSTAEVGFDATVVPYKNEVSSKAKEVTFSLYTNDASRVKKNYNGTGSNQNWWLRSPAHNTTNQYRIVGTGGLSSSSNVLISNSVAAGFSA